MHSDRTPDISVLVCTFRRTHLLPNLLRRLAAQEHLGSLATEIVVVDNCPDRSAAETVATLAAEIPSLHYVAEPRPGISNARNTGIRHLRGRLVAFIDDDEQPQPDWLHQLVKTQTETGADAVFGPVLPIFVKPVEDFPRLYEAAFTQSSDAPTGTPMDRKKLL
ncbi:glycosyltransferase family 2 protein, partial [Azospirillum rugosum]